MEVGELWAKLKVDMSPFSTSMNEARNKMQAAADDIDRKLAPALSKIESAIKIAGAAVVTGFGAIVASGVKANANMEQYRNTLNTVMGDSQKAAETLDWVKQYAASTPFEIPELVESTVKLQAMGLEAQKMIPVAADMAAVFKSSGKTVGDATEAINDAVMGEFERLKEFGIKLQATDFSAGGKYAGKTYAEALMEEVKNHNYTGASEGLGKTFTGRLSTVKDTIGQALQGITAPIFDKVAAGMGSLIDKINELQANGQLQAWTDQATASMTKMWDITIKIGGVVVDIAKGIIEHWNLIGPILAGVLAGFMAYQTVTGVIRAVELAQAALNLVMAANPIALLVLAIAGLVAAGVVLYQNWDTVKAKASELWGHITGVWENIKQTTIDKFDSIKEFFIKWGPLMLAALAGPIGLAVYAIVKHWDDVKAKTMEIWTAIKDWLSGMWDTINAQISSAWDSIYNVISGIWTRIKEGFNNLIQSAKDWGRNLINEFIDGIKDMFGELDDILHAAASKVADFLGFSSPTKKGPGREADRWAPNFVKMFAEGIISSLPSLEFALNIMAGSIRPAMLGSTISNTQVSTTKNNYGQNTIVIQAYNWDQLERELAKRGVRI